MSKNSDGDTQSQPIHGEIIAEEEEFSGGEPVCWLEMLDDEGTMPDQGRGHVPLPCQQDARETWNPRDHSAR